MGKVRDGCQHVRAVGALLAAHPHQATGFEVLEHPVQQQVLGPAGDKAGAELGQDA